MSKFKAKDFEQKLITPCAHDGCPDAAIIAKKLPTGWGFICKAHYEFHTSREAKEFCDLEGLITREQKKDFCKANMPKFSSREPGQEG